MRPPFHIMRSQTGFVSGLLLFGLLLGQPGLGVGLLELMGAGVVCTSDCPCAEASGESNAESSLESTGNDGQLPDEDPCPDDRPCAPSCEDCACCAGALTATVTPASVSLLKATPMSLEPFWLHAEPATGVLGRIYRPPQLSCI